MILEFSVVHLCNDNMCGRKVYGSGKSLSSHPGVTRSQAH